MAHQRLLHTDTAGTAGGKQARRDLLQVAQLFAFEPHRSPQGLWAPVYLA